MAYTQHFSTKQTAQSQPIPGKKMTPNSAGGYSFAVDHWTQLDRFLVLGSEGGTYYISEKKLTVDNAKNVIKCIAEDGVRVVTRIVEVSHNGRAPKNDPAIFALALVATFGNEQAKQAAYAAIQKVCRIGTHIFQFCEEVQALRGWSRGLRRGVAAFYQNASDDQLAYQIIKYQQRNGWTHRDVLRLSHPIASSLAANQILKYSIGKAEGNVHPQIDAFERLKALGTSNKKLSAQIIAEHRLPRECVPTELLNEVVVWEALLKDMPMTALIRNLGKMTSIGLIGSNLDTHTKAIVEKLTDVSVLKKARVHPLNLLVSMLTYAQGHGDKGSLRWNPASSVVAALDQAFYSSFDFVEPTNKNWFLAVDVSGSMTSPMGRLPLSYSQAAAAMAMLAVRTEKFTELKGFDTGMKDFKITKNDSFARASQILQGYNGGGTDCSMPMQYAQAKKIPVDVFTIYTDSETYAGRIHPCQALKSYRQAMGIPAKLIVVGMAGNKFTIADPNDGGSLDVVGFDTSVPAIMADFVTN